MVSSDTIANFFCLKIKGQKVIIMQYLRVITALRRLQNKVL